jgi:large subunit ribosomal protein L35
MPKMKSNSGAAKRFHRTGGGGYKRSHAFKNHILTKKAPKRKRRLRKTPQVAEQDQAEIRRLLPYR